jgi:hypothetical protein
MLIDTRFTKNIEQSSAAPAEIRRHLNGSIDLDHYVRIGREAHGAAFRGWLRSIGEAFGRLFGGAAAQ